jgi:tight adherence protein B
MAILLIAFIGTLVIMFVSLAVALRPSNEVQALHRRMSRIQTGGQSSEVSDDLGNYMAPAESSSFAWIEDLIEHSPIAQGLRNMILQADSSSSVGTLLVTSIGLAAVAMTLTFLFSHMLVAAGAAAVATAYLPIAIMRFRGKRRLDNFNRVLPDAIDMMARSLRAGHSLAAALGIVAEQAAEPVKAEFTEVFKKQNFGLPLRDALMQLLDRVPSQDLRVLVTAILVQKDTGGNLVDILDRTVAVIRERIRIQGEIRTHTAQGRLTGWILCALPVVMLVAINLINPGYSTVLFSDPFGQKILGGGVALLIVGGLIIRSIINGIEV